jgi:hypothetical protein
MFSLQQSTLPFNAVQTLTILASKLPIFKIPCWDVFTNVVDLRLYCDFAGCTLDDYIYPLSSILPRLRSLFISSSSFRSLYCAMSLILSLSELQELHFLDLIWSSVGNPEELLSIPTIPAPLRHLYVSLVRGALYPKPIVDLLVELGPALSLWSFWTDFEVLDILLRERCCSSLKVLDLRFCGPLFRLLLKETH